MIDRYMKHLFRLRTTIEFRIAYHGLWTPNKSQKSENLGRWGRQNMLWPYLKIWYWDLIFSRALKAISSPVVRSPCS